MQRRKRSKYGRRRQQKAPRSRAQAGPMGAVDPSGRDATFPPLEEEEPMATDALVRQVRNSTSPD